MMPTSTTVLQVDLNKEQLEPQKQQEPGSKLTAESSGTTLPGWWQYYHEESCNMLQTWWCRIAQEIINPPIPSSKERPIDHDVPSWLFLMLILLITTMLLMEVFLRCWWLARSCWVAATMEQNNEDYPIMAELLCAHIRLLQR